MASQRPTTITAYIRAAPSQGQPLLRRLHAILAEVAPQAQQTIKWGTPFFVEPRFLFAFSAHRKHCSFAPGAAALQAFEQQLRGHDTTKQMLRLPYDAPLPEKLIRDLAAYRVRTVGERADDAFW